MRKLFENSGNQLFKYRGQIPLVLVLNAIIVIYCHPNITDFTLFFGKKMTLFITFIFIFFGHLIRALVVGTRGMHTSGKNRDQQVAHQLNNTGLYSMVRHPLYLGNLMIWIGIFYWVGNFWFLLIGVVFFILLYFPIMRIENDFLEEKFGEEYVDWSIKTPLFLPNPLLYKRAVNPFSFKMVWKNEISGNSFQSFQYLVCFFVALNVYRRKINNFNNTSSVCTCNCSFWFWFTIFET